MHLSLLPLLLLLASFSAETLASPATRLNGAARRSRLSGEVAARHPREHRAPRRKRATTTTTTTSSATSALPSCSGAASTVTVYRTVVAQAATTNATSTSSRPASTASSSKPVSTAANTSTVATSKASSVLSTSTSSKAVSTNGTSSIKPSTTVAATSSTLRTNGTSTITSSLKPTSSAAPNTTTTTAWPPFTTSTQVNGPLPNPPASSAQKQVFAHHMVGNTYSYTPSTWSDDISLALGAGIDAFALNTGIDYWQSARVADAYAAAKGTAFKLFMSLDMTSLGCANEADAVILRNYVTTYANHTNQAKYKGKQLVSTFSGEWCTFGESSTQLGWQKHFLLPLAAMNISISFMPSIFSDPSTFSTAQWYDGLLNWNSGWPMGASNLDTSSDTSWMSALGTKSYMAAVSPAFFTYYSPSSWNKDWIYRGDNWLYATRWESIVSMRDQLDLVEILTWNDYGESSYVGPIRADQPNSQAWVDNFPHQAYLEMTSYYATAFKTGKWPTVSADKMFVWSRPHPKNATATAPSMARPTRWEDTDDLTFALIMATQSGKVTLTSGSSKQAVSVSAGITKFAMTSMPGQVGISMTRSDGTTVANTWPASQFNYTLSPVDYNYNYWVGST